LQFQDNVTAKDKNNFFPAKVIWGGNVVLNMIRCLVCLVFYVFLTYCLVFSAYGIRTRYIWHRPKYTQNGVMYH